MSGWVCDRCAASVDGRYGMSGAGHAIGLCVPCRNEVSGGPAFTAARRFIQQHYSGLSYEMRESDEVLWFLEVAVLADDIVRLVSRPGRALWSRVMERRKAEAEVKAYWRSVAAKKAAKTRASNAARAARATRHRDPDRKAYMKTYQADWYQRNKERLKHAKQAQLPGL